MVTPILHLYTDPAILQAAFLAGCMMIAIVTAMKAVQGMGGSHERQR